MSETAREPDELDRRIRALEAERMRPVPGIDVGKDAEKRLTTGERKSHNLAESADAFLARMQREFSHWHPQEPAPAKSTGRKRRSTSSPQPHPQNGPKSASSGAESAAGGCSDPQGQKRTLEVPEEVSDGP